MILLGYQKQIQVATIWETESSREGTRLYISSKFNLKLIYEKRELESVFMGIPLEKEKNIKVGCIYKHQDLELESFNNIYFLTLIDTLSRENKNCFNGI